MKILLDEQMKEAINTEFEKEKYHYDFATIEGGAALKHFVAHYPNRIYKAMLQAQLDQDKEDAKALVEALTLGVKLADAIVRDIEKQKGKAPSVEVLMVRATMTEALSKANQ